MRIDAKTPRLRATLLKPGTILRDEEGNILDARSSVTLVTSGTAKIVVDTGLAGEDGIILEGLAGQGLKPDDLDVVINTHAHPDHCGNNHLFTRARILSKERGNAKEGDVVAPGVWIMETPGHSMDSISVILESSRRVVVAGDALPIMGNYLKWVPPRLHVDRDLAMKSMSRIVEIAEIVVPGHDLPFSTKEEMYVASLD